MEQHDDDGEMMREPQASNNEAETVVATSRLEIDEKRAQRAKFRRDYFERSCLQLLENDPSLSFFVFVGEFSDDDANQMAKSLKGNTSLKSFYWHSSLSPDGAGELTAAIEQSSVEELSFTCWGQRNACSAIFSQQDFHPSQTIRRRQMSSVNKVSDAPVFHFLLNSTSMQEFRLRAYDMLSVDESLILAAGIAQSHLTEFRIYPQSVRGEINVEVLQAIFIGVGYSQTIRTFHFADDGGCGPLRQRANDAHDLLLACLSRVLRNNSTIQHLDFRLTGISDRGLALFLRSWSADSPIQELRFAWTAIGQAGALSLIQSVALHPHLQTLDLSQCLGIGHAGLLQIAEELPNLRLKRLQLNCCAEHYPNENYMDFVYFDSNGESFVDEEGYEIFLQKGRAGSALLEGIQHNIHLYHFDVSGNGFDSDVEDGIAFYTLLNRNGRYLLSMNHGLAATVWCHILARCKDEVGAIYFFLQEQPELCRFTARDASSF